MPDWLIKILASIVSVKTASIALLTCISLIALWSKGTLIMKNSSVPEDYMPYFIIIILYSISHIIVIWSIRLWEGMSSLLSKRGLSHDNKVSLKTFQGSIKKMMPHFPYEQLKILKQLSQGEREYSLKKEGIYYLEKSKFINRMYEVTFDSFIFQINPLVKSVLSDYLISIRTESLKSFVENITEVEKRFLSVFFEDIIHEGTCESGKMMRPDVFSSSSSMVSKDFLEHFSRGSKTSSKEGFRLYPETEKILEKVVFGKSCVRKEVCLDTRFILAGASGSGSIGHTKGKGIGLF